MGCCGGMKVAPAVMRAIAPMLKAKPLAEAPIVVLGDPSVISCPYCGAAFEDRVVEVRAGVWKTRRWCSHCKLRFM